MLYGQRDTLKRLCVTLLYLACWIVLSYTYTDTGEYYYTKTEPKDWSVHSWKIIFEVCVNLYFILEGINKASYKSRSSSYDGPDIIRLTLKQETFYMLTWRKSFLFSAEREIKSC